MAENLDNEMRLVQIEDLRHCLIAAFQRLELPPEDAEQVAEVLLDSELRGHESHGVHLLGFLADAYRGGMNPRPHIRVLRESEGALLLEGDHSHVVGAVRAMRWCIERARERKGMAVAGVRNSQLIMPGFYARMAAEAGLISFVCANAIPMVAPPGGRTATFGSNPFAYAIPAGRYPPVVLDVATTTGAAFKVRSATQPSGDRRHDPRPRRTPHHRPERVHPGWAHGTARFPCSAPQGVRPRSGLRCPGRRHDRGCLRPRFGQRTRHGRQHFFWALDVEAFLPREEFLRGWRHRSSRSRPVSDWRASTNFLFQANAAAAAIRD